MQVAVGPVHDDHGRLRASGKARLRRDARRSTSRVSFLEYFVLAVVALVVLYAAVYGPVSDIEQAAAGIQEGTVAVRVGDGQTLWEIASRYRTAGMSTAATVEHIRRVNGLETSAVTAGQVLEIPAPSKHLAVAAR